MSLQTGVEIPEAPASTRVVDRVRFRFSRWRAEPNPLWMREMRQMARLMRTPIVLMTLTLLVALLMAALGGTMMDRKSPAVVGAVLFQVFFSVAFFVVTMVGPALAANAIASEREGKTWEAVLLTGIRPQEVARGKFLAAYTSVALYIVALAPAGAIPFLFGGVTPGEVFIAFAFLFLVGLLAVAFGLAISSKMQSLRGALLVTLLLAVPVAGFAYATLGFGTSYAIHDIWKPVARGYPIWLPMAYVRGEFGLEYVVVLVVMPLLLIGLPAWFLYEVTAANLAGPSDDRSSGIKRWYVVASATLLLAGLSPLLADASRSARTGYVAAAMLVYCTFAAFATFVFAGEPLGPSRRVAARFAAKRAGALRRFFGPGAVSAAVLQIIVAVPTLLLLAGGALAAMTLGRSPSKRDVDGLMVFTAYATGFFIFLVGLAAALRSRTQTPLVARLLLLAVLFGVSVLPWIAAAIFGVFGSGRSSSLVAACASPFYVFYALDNVRKSDPVTASLAASAAYAALGVLLLLAAVKRSRRIMAEYRQYLETADRLLDEEDRGAAAAREAARHAPAFVPAAVPETARDDTAHERSGRQVEAEPMAGDAPSADATPRDEAPEPARAPRLETGGATSTDADGADG